MHVLVTGTPLWWEGYPKTPWLSPAGHEVRTLRVEGTGAADYTFAPHEEVADLVARIDASWPVDLLYCVTPEHFPPPLEVEACPVKTVAVISDWNLHQPALDHNLARFDVVISDRPGAEQLRIACAKPHYVAPIYSHVPAVHYPRAVERDIDVLFLGNLNHAIHRSRGYVLAQVAALADRYRVVIHGGLPPEEYAAMLSRARIAINYGVRHEMNLRCFEAVACGALLLLESDNRETPDWLPPGVAAVYYEEDRVAETIVRYLEDEAARSRIAAEGLRRAPALAMEARIDRFFEFAAAQPQGARGFNAFDEETQAIATALLYGGSHAEPQRAWALQTLSATLEVFDSAASALALGGLALDANAVRVALCHYQQAAERAPGDATPWLCLAQIARAAGEPALEERWLTRAAEATSAELAGFFNAPVTNPWFAEVRRLLALGRDTLPVLRSAARARLARLAQSRGDHQNALHRVDESIAAWDHAAESHRLRGEILRALRKPMEAAEAFATATTCDPFDDAANQNHVQMLHEAGRKVEARDAAARCATRFSACSAGHEIAAQFRAWAAE